MARVETSMWREYEKVRKQVIKGLKNNKAEQIKFTKGEYQTWNSERKEVL